MEMAVSSSPILSPFGVNIISADFGSSSTGLPRFNFCSIQRNNRRPSPVIVLSSSNIIVLFFQTVYLDSNFVI